MITLQGILKSLISKIKIGDKIVHILAGLAISLLVGLPCYFASSNLFVGIWASLSGIFAGIVKEWCDVVYTDKYDKKDFLFTCIGVLIYIAILLLVHII